MNAFNLFAENAAKQTGELLVDNKTVTDLNNIPPNSTGTFINYHQGTTTPVTMPWGDQWVPIPLGNNSSICALYVKNSMISEIDTTNLKNTIYGAAQMLIAYGSIYGKCVHAYLTGYTDPNNFKIEATLMGSNVNFIVYNENGLLNIVASYIK